MEVKRLAGRRTYDDRMGQAQSKRRDVPRHPVSQTTFILHDGREKVCIIEERSPLGSHPHQSQPARPAVLRF